MNNAVKVENGSSNNVEIFENDDYDWNEKMNEKYFELNSLNYPNFDSTQY